ncbi:MAG TPA: ATP-binding protein [Bryobacteraceae bacterium]|jgi:signal transduction histidine kinase|nr:ATP-binding protein [Bryobacteraceae bacterium]
MRRRFSRLSLLTKILLSTSVAVTVLFALTGELVLGHITQTMSDSLQVEVQNGFQAYKSLFESREELLSSVSRLLASMADVRRAIGTGDQATVADSAGELWSMVSDSNAIFLVTDPDGKVIASLGGVTTLPLDKNLEVVPEASRKFPLQSTGFLLQNGELYQISVTPVYVDSTHGRALLKVLVAGYRVDASVVQRLKERTNSEFLVTTPGRVIVSTLNPRATEAVVRATESAPGSGRVSDGILQYARLVTPLMDIVGKPVGEICILRPFEGAQRIARLYTTIILIWALAVSIGLGFTYLMARRIIEPVKQLDRAAAEVARQNYAIEVEVTSDDEMGRLARTFNNMCASIRQAREDLIRQERISTIGRLSGSIVHDLRNPLAAIYGGAEMLVDGDLPPGHVKRLAGNIYRASRRIQELLQDLLNVSRGKTAAPEMCRLREVALAACDSLGAAAEAQGVGLDVSIPSEIEVPLERSRMERAFVNLIGNALEAMPGGGEVRISAVLERSSVVVQVEDTGPGIAPQIRSSLFQPFVTAGKRNGLGLGLALTRQTVLEHGGDMWVESESGHGARFKFRLPGAQVSQVQSLHA